MPTNSTTASQATIDPCLSSAGPRSTLTATSEGERVASVPSARRPMPSRESCATSAAVSGGGNRRSACSMRTIVSRSPGRWLTDQAYSQDGDVHNPASPRADGPLPASVWWGIPFVLVLSLGDGSMRLRVCVCILVAATMSVLVGASARAASPTPSIGLYAHFHAKLRGSDRYPGVRGTADVFEAPDKASINLYLRRAGRLSGRRLMVYVGGRITGAMRAGSRGGAHFKAPLVEYLRI